MRNYIKHIDSDFHKKKYPSLNKSEWVDIDKLIIDLIDDEGEVLHAYRDHLGYLTIGVGHLIDKRKDGQISQEASRFILSEDIDDRIKRLNEELPWFSSLSEVRQRAFLNMSFQLGVAGFLEFKNTLEFAKNGDWENVYNGCLNSLWAEQTPDRAERIARMLRDNEG